MSDHQDMLKLWPDVLTFWFEECTPEQWFRKDAAFDQAIRERFGALYEAGLAGALEPWREAPPRCLALIVLLDQFSRNLFRDDARAFGADEYALTIAKGLVGSGGHLALSPVQRGFAYLPYEHSEDIGDQRRCVELMAALGDETSLDYARRHLVIIERFGRFPHRNQTLGRTSTKAEIAFLKEPNSSF